ncbi:MAG: ribosome biogenesis GTP-binding protein YihA/YsxC [Minisyncoccia bacterium]
MSSKITSAKFIKGVVGDDAIVKDGKDQIAFVGRSNVGKSSLINALVGRNDLVKVSSTPGKTQEINFFLINTRFYFVDLPGYGYAKVSPKDKEKIFALIRGYITAPHIAPKVVVLVLDSKVGVTDFDSQMLDLLKKKGHPCIIAANKIDALSQKDLSAQIKKISAEAPGILVIPCSAKKGTRVETLVDALLAYTKQ